jgi:hypothetical protein
MAAVYRRTLYGRDAGRPWGHRRIPGPRRRGGHRRPALRRVLRVLEWTLAGYDRWAPCAAARATGCRTRRPSTTTPRPTAPTSASWPGRTPTSAAVPGHGPPGPARRRALRHLADRARHGDEINGVVAEWTGATAGTDRGRCVRHDVPVGTAYSACRHLRRPHMAARDDLITVDDPVLGPSVSRRRSPASSGRDMVGPPGAQRCRGRPWPRARLGADNRMSIVWCDLVGLSDPDGPRSSPCAAGARASPPTWPAPA